MSKIKIRWISFILLIACAGCAANTAATETVDVSAVITEAAQTVEAALAQTAAAADTQTVTETPTLTLTPTASPSTAPTVMTQPGAVQPATSVPVSYSACDVAGFVSDVTIPDGTVILGGNAFTKTWRLRNDGTCTWTSDYELVFYSGSQMDGASGTQLTSDSVAPGETIDVSVELVAPETAGTYYGYWKLQNASGTNFGIGTGGSAFYVMIVIETAATYTPTTTTTVTATSEATTAPTATPTTAPTATAKPTNTSAPTATASATTAPTDTPVPSETPEGG